MEILLALLVELIINAIYLSLVLFAEIAVIILDIVVPWAYHRIIDARDRRRRQMSVALPQPAPPSATAPAAPPTDGFDRRSKTSIKHRRFRCVLWSAMATTIIGLVAANYFFVDDLIRMALSRAEARTGIHFEFESASGSLFSGSGSISQLRVRRLDSPSSEFDLLVKTTEFDIHLLGLLRGDFSFDRVRLDGVEGYYHRTAATTERPPHRRFRVDKLETSNVHLLISDDTREPALIVLPLHIANATTTPLRSHWAAYDVLFHTNATGTLDGQPLEIASTRNGEEYHYRWDASRLPVRLLSSFLGRFWEAFDSGGARVLIEGTTSGTSIDLTATIAADDLKLKTKENAGWLSKRLVAAIQKRLDKHAGKLNLSASARLDRTSFEGAISPDALAVWQELADAVTEKFAEKTGIAKEKITEAGRNWINKLRSRKPKE